jgi:hypothetical protein
MWRDAIQKRRRVLPQFFIQYGVLAAASINIGCKTAPQMPPQQQQMNASPWCCSPYVLV